MLSVFPDKYTGLLTHTIQKSSAESKIMFYITLISVDEMFGEILKLLITFGLQGMQQDNLS